MGELIKELLFQAKRRWYGVGGLLLAEFLLIAALLSLFAWVRLEQFSRTEIGACIVVSVTLVLVWHLTRRVPKAKRGTIGFVVAITAETKEHRQRIVADFVHALRDLLTTRTAALGACTFIELPDHYARKIVTPDLAIRYVRKARSHFMLFGRARLRSLDQAEHHIIKLDGVVLHPPISETASARLGQEFREVLPRDLRIERENDLLSFEFTADRVTVVAQYIIGIAAFMSGHFNYSQSLFERLANTFKGGTPNLPLLRKIARRLPTRLSEVYGAQALRRHRAWRDTRDPSFLKQIGAYLDRLQEVAPSNYSGHLMRAMWHFATNRDVNSAILELRKCRDEGVKDTTWRYGYAFLLGYRGELPQAHRQYQVASGSPVGATVPIEVEEFILWVLGEEPDKVQLYFCLGCINYYAKVDPIRALDDFTTFLDTSDQKSGQYREARRIAGQRVIELRRELRTEELKD